MTDQQMTELVRATERAAEVADQRHGGVEHGDNDPEATAALLTDRALLDRRIPPVAPAARGRAMCAAWADHERVES